MKAAELRERLEDGVREFMAKVEDEDFIPVGPGTYKGNSFTQIGSIVAWFSGPANPCGTTLFTAGAATATLLRTKCPSSGAKMYTIVVRPLDDTADEQGSSPGG